MAVESANIVGYNVQSPNETDFIIGCSFENVTTGGGMTLGSLSGDFEDYDNIQVASIVNNRIVFSDFYFFDAQGGMVAETGWYYDDMVTSAADFEIPLGAAVWFGSSSAKAVTTSGAVRNTSFTHTFQETPEMICPAFPVGFNPNAASWTGLVDYDNIQVSSIVNNRILFTDYYFFDAAGGMAAETGWYCDDMVTKVDDAIVAPGQGFWFTFQGDVDDVTLTETSPIAQN